MESEKLIPMDINNYLCTYEPGKKLRNYDKNDFNFFIKHKQYFRNSFFIGSARLWNSIPSVLKTCSTLNSFRKNFRTYYESNLYLLSASSSPGCK